MITRSLISRKCINTVQKSGQIKGVLSMTFRLQRTCIVHLFLCSSPAMHLCSIFIYQCCLRRGSVQCLDGVVEWGVWDEEKEDGVGNPDCSEQVFQRGFPDKHMFREILPDYCDPNQMVLVSIVLTEDPCPLCARPAAEIKQGLFVVLSKCQALRGYMETAYNTRSDTGTLKVPLISKQQMMDWLTTWWMIIEKIRSNFEVFKSLETPQSYWSTQI